MERSPQSLVGGLISGSILAGLAMTVFPFEGIVAIVVGVLAGALLGLGLRIVRIMNEALPGFQRTTMITFNVIVIGLAVGGAITEVIQLSIVPLVVLFVTLIIINLTVPNSFIITRLEKLFPNLEFSEPEY